LDRIYGERKLIEGHPELKQRSLEVFFDSLERESGDGAFAERLIQYLDRILDLDHYRRVLIIGSGPRPEDMRVLSGKGFTVSAIEPVAKYVESANEFLGIPGCVREGAAEAIGVGDETQDIVVCNSVLEHVDSPLASLVEMHRVLRPGGVLYVQTTNRYRFSPKGMNYEYNVPFFNWFPRVVQEAYVFLHLHYDPRLANYSERPATHWFSYADLCQVGRLAGFGHFYSLLDLLGAGDPRISNSPIKAWVLEHIRTNPWLRGAALVQFGNTIVMVKR
jgi:SAM-dependent methyltransferase